MIAPNGSRHLLWSWAAALAVVSALIELHPLGDSDTFWHLTLGRAVLAQHTRTVVEPVAFAAFNDHCVCPEWLWEVATYVVYRAGGARALVALMAAVAALGALAVIALVERARDKAANAPAIAVSALTMTAVLSRLTARPQAAAAVMLASFTALSLSYFAAPRDRRRTLILALFAMEVVWAQLHGSFVLAPIVFTLGIVAHRDSLKQAAERPLHLLTLLLLLVGLMTGAHGIDIAAYIGNHASGDAVRHIEDMRAPTWASATPVAPYGAAFLVLCLLCLSGAIASLQRRRFALLLGLLGAALFLIARRFIDAAAILMTPLAMGSAEDLLARVNERWQKLLTLASITASALLGSWFAFAARAWWGPFGHAAVHEAKLPALGARAIAQLPRSQIVLGDYDSDSPLGFWLAGHARVFVDGRTPLFYDDADYAAARDLWERPQALPNALARYRVTSVVAPRASAMCSELAKRWAPIAIEARYTTFANGVDGLRSLAPCGEGYFRADACTDGGAAVLDDLQRLEALQPSPFVKLLRAGLLAHCHRATAEVRAALPQKSEAWEYAEDWNRLSAQLLITEGQTKEALALVEDQIENGDATALATLMPALLDAVPIGRVRALYDAVARHLDDAAPATFHAELARICMAQGDASCVRARALRAAVQGSPAALEPLRWLVAHAPSARVRDDAQEWIQRLERASDPNRL
jgi:hypothetical protein